MADSLLVASSMAFVMGLSLFLYLEDAFVS